MNENVKVEIIKPQKGPQTAFAECTSVDIVCYGGARGGGKSWAMALDFWLHAERYGSDARGLMLRKTREDLKDFIDLASRMYGNAARYMEKGNVFREPGRRYGYFCRKQQPDFAVPGRSRIWNRSDIYWTAIRRGYDNHGNRRNLHEWPRVPWHLGQLDQWTRGGQCQAGNDHRRVQHGHRGQWYNDCREHRRGRLGDGRLAANANRSRAEPGLRSAGCVLRPQS